MEMKLDLPGGSLYFDFYKPGKNEQVNIDAVSLVRCSSHLVEATIPPTFQIPFGEREGEILPVIDIKRKAFLGNKRLKRVVIPEGVRSIGEWAFASCSSLASVEFESDFDIRFGKGVFLNCNQLEALRICGRDSQFAALLASVAMIPETAYLLNLREAGSQEWIRKYDARLMDLLQRPDEEGFSKQILCGEEDYGSTNKELYESNQRREKIRFFFLRMMNDQGLSEELREKLLAYLLEHTAGKEQDETWRVILEEKGDLRSWYGCFVELGCLTKENLDGVLLDIGEGNPEMKAYFLDAMSKRSGSGPGDQNENDGNGSQLDHFFADLEL